MGFFILEETGTYLNFTEFIQNVSVDQGRVLWVKTEQVTWCIKGAMGRREPWGLEVLHGCREHDFTCDYVM